jgi:hypothetical protein
MERSALRLVAVALTLALAGGACSSEEPPDAPDQVTGVLTDVESFGIGDIRGFTIKDGSDTFEINIDPEVEYGFDLGHLQEHLSGSLPVTVELEERDGVLYALSIEDA